MPKKLKVLRLLHINEAILTAVNNAINLGLEEKQVAAAINNYVAAYAEIDLTSTAIPNNKYKNNTTIKPIHVYFRVESIGAYAFSRSNLKINSTTCKK